MQRFAIAVLPFAVACAVAQDTTHVVSQTPVMDEVVVTATRSEKTLDEAPAHATVVTKQQIEQQHVQTVDDALKHESGVYVRRTKGLADAMASVFMRGLYGQNRTLVLMNGLPINSGYDGGVSWNEISAENIERIEVVRGPSSALYGGYAMGGVINIITARPQELEIEAKAGYGSDNTIRHSFHAGDRIDEKFWFRVGYEMEETDGYVANPVTRNVSKSAIGGGTTQLHGGHPTQSTTGAAQWTIGDRGDNWAQKWNANLQLGYDITKTGTVFLDFQYGHHEYGYDRPHTYMMDSSGNAAMSGRMNVGNGYATASITPSTFVSGTGPGSEDYVITGIGYDDKFGELVMKTRVGFQTRDAWYATSSATTNQNYYTSPGDYSQSTMRAWLADWQGSIPVLDDHTVTFGVYFRYDDLSQEGYDVSFYRDPDSKTVKTDLTDGADCSQALYFQDEWKVMENLTVYGGLRFDHWSAFDGQSGPVSKVEKFDAPDDWALTPKFSAVWHAMDDTYVRGSIGEAFRAPTLYEMYRTWFSGTTTYHSNPNLEPETIWNFEGGVDQYFWDRKIKAGVTYFHSILDNVISSYTTNNIYGTRDSYKENVANAQLDGVEAELSFQPWDWLRLWGNYTYTLSEVLKNDRQPDAEGQRLPSVPDEMVKLGADVSYKWIQCGISGRYTGRIYTTELNNDEEDVYGGYTKCWLWDTHLTIKPIERLKVSFYVDNVFDREYYSYYIGRGRSYYVELALKW